MSYVEWTAPIVTVSKNNGKFRICSNYKVTIDPVLQTDQYPLPEPEELFIILAGGSKFSKLDLSQAYTQILLDDTSAEHVTVNTDMGLCNYRRSPYGVVSVPTIFQKCMETMLQGIPYVVIYIVDTVITGKGDVQHSETFKMC